MPQFYFQWESDPRVSGHEAETLDSAYAAMAHADKMAEELGRHHSDSENIGRFVVVTDADGDEVYRTPLGPQP